MGVPLIRIIVYWVYIADPPFREIYHISSVEEGPKRIGSDCASAGVTSPDGFQGRVVEQASAPKEHDLLLIV